MGTYAITGTASGIGAAVAARLRDQGDVVIGVDIRDAEIPADLATMEGRSRAIDGIMAKCGGALAGLVTCAGVGPQFPDRAAIVSINYFASIALVEGLGPALEAASGSVVIVSSNSATLDAYDADLIDMMLAGNETDAMRRAAELHPMTLYGGSKLALLRWMRRHSADWARRGVRMNAVAPGFTHTAITAGGLQDPTFRQGILDYLATIPMARGAEPAEQAGPIVFLLNSDASYVCGSVLYVDGGYDALVRGDRF